MTRRLTTRQAAAVLYLDGAGHATVAAVSHRLYGTGNRTGRVEWMLRRLARRGMVAHDDAGWGLTGRGVALVDRAFRSG